MSAVITHGRDGTLRGGRAQEAHPVDNRSSSAENTHVRTGSREFLEWIDLDEKDFRAIGRVCRPVLRLTLLLVPAAIVAALMIWHADVIFSWLRSP